MRSLIYTGYTVQAQTNSTKTATSFPLPFPSKTRTLHPSNKHVTDTLDHVDATVTKRRCPIMEALQPPEPHPQRPLASRCPAPPHQHAPRPRPGSCTIVAKRRCHIMDALQAPGVLWHYKALLHPSGQHVTDVYAMELHCIHKDFYPLPPRRVFNKLSPIQPEIGSTDSALA